MHKVAIEEEFHTVDLATRRLVSAAPMLSERLSVDPFPESGKATVVALTTTSHAQLARLQGELVDRRGVLAREAGRLRLGVMACGTAPMTNMSDVRLAPEGEPESDHLPAEPDRALATCGLRVRIDIEDRDLAARAMAWMTGHLSTLLALSASSPFWCRRDTGYASWRHVLVERFPSSGPAGPLRSAREYDDLIRTLDDLDPGREGPRIHPALRLRRQAPALELRVCDAVPDVESAIAIAALFRALYARASDAVATGAQPPEVSAPLARAAMWRAARSGLEGELIDPVAAVASPAATVVRRLVVELEPWLRAAEDFDHVESTIEDVLAHGNGAARQRVAAHDGGVEAAVDRMLARTIATIALSESDARTGIDVETGSNPPATVPESA